MTKQSSSVEAKQTLDCFAEPVIGPATSGRTRWLAMTSSIAVQAGGLSPLPLRLCALPRRELLPLRDGERALGPHRKFIGIVIETVRQPPIGQGVLGAATRCLAARIGERAGAFALKIRNARLVGFQINRAAHDEAEHHAVAIEPGAGEHALHRHQTKLREQIADEVNVQCGDQWSFCESSFRGRAKRFEIFPPPLWGRVGRGVVWRREASTPVIVPFHPHPYPSPQGGGEQFCGRVPE
jgi:hypothetical protein